MAQYIYKSALVAEIEKLIERAKAERVLHPKTILAAKNYLLIEDYKKLLSFIDTLEVKGVDLNEEIANQYEANYEEYLTYEEFADIAKHFFELGMVVSNKQIEEKEDINSQEEECNAVYKDIVLIDRDGNRIKARMEQRGRV